jgi:hypothetical protein
MLRGSARWARPKKFKGVKLTDLKDTHTRDRGPTVSYAEIERAARCSGTG